MSANFLTQSITALVRHALAEGQSVETIINQTVDGLSQAHPTLNVQELFNHVSRLAGRQPWINTAAVQRPALITPETQAAPLAPSTPSETTEPSDMNMVFMGGNLNTIDSMAIPDNCQSSPQLLMEFVNSHLANHASRMDIAQVWISNKGAIAGRYQHDRVNGTLSPL